MAKRILINPDNISSNDALILQGRGGESHITEGAGVNMVTVGQSNDAVFIGEQFAGGTVIDVDAEKGAEIKLDDGSTQWVQTANMNTQILPYVKGNKLDLIASVKGGLTSVTDYDGFDVTENDIKEAKYLAQYTDSKNNLTGLREAIQDGIDSNTIRKYFTVSDSDIENVNKAIQQTEINNNLSKYLNKDGKYYIDNAIDLGATDAELKQMNFTPEQIKNARDLKKLDKYKSDDGKFYLDNALKLGASDDELKQMNFTPQQIQNAKENRSLERFLSDDGKYYLDNAINLGATDAELKLMKFDEQSIKNAREVKRLISKYEDANGDVYLSNALKEGATDAELAILNFSPEQIREARENKSYNDYIDNMEKAGYLKKTESGYEADYEKLAEDGQLDLLKRTGLTNAEVNDIRSYYDNTVKVGNSDTRISKEAWASVQEAIKQIPDMKTKENLIQTLQKDGLDAYNKAYTSYFESNHKKLGDVWITNDSFNEIMATLKKIPEVDVRGKMVGMLSKGDLDSFNQAVKDYVNIKNLDRDELNKYSWSDLDRALELVGEKDIDEWKRNYLSSDLNQRLIDGYVKRMNEYYNNPKGTVQDYIYEADSTTLDAINKVYGTDYSFGKLNDAYIKANNIDYTKPDNRDFGTKAKDFLLKDSGIINQPDDIKALASNIGIVFSGVQEIKGDNPVQYVQNAWKNVVSSGVVAENLKHIANYTTEEWSNKGAKLGREINSKNTNPAIKSSTIDKGIEGLMTAEQWLTEQASKPQSKAWKQIDKILVETVPNNILDMGILGLTTLKGLTQIDEGNSEEGMKTLGNLGGKFVTYALTLPEKAHNDETADQGWAEIASILIPIPSIKGLKGGLKTVGQKASNSTFSKVSEKYNVLTGNNKVQTNVVLPSKELPLATGQITFPKDVKGFENRPDNRVVETGHIGLENGKSVEYAEYKDAQGNRNILITDPSLKTWDQATNKVVWDVFTDAVINTKNEGNNASVSVTLGNMKLSGNKDHFNMAMVDKDGNAVNVSTDKGLNPFADGNLPRVTKDGVVIEKIKNGKVSLADGNISTVILDAKKFDWKSLFPQAINKLQSQAGYLDLGRNRTTTTVLDRPRNTSKPAQTVKPTQPVNKEISQFAKDLWKQVDNHKTNSERYRDYVKVVNANRVYADKLKKLENNNKVIAKNRKQIDDAQSVVSKNRKLNERNASLVKRKQREIDRIEKENIKNKAILEQNPTTKKAKKNKYKYQVTEKQVNALDKTLFNDEMRLYRNEQKIKDAQNRVSSIDVPESKTQTIKKSRTNSVENKSPDARVNLITENKTENKVVSRSEGMPARRSLSDRAIPRDETRIETKSSVSSKIEAKSKTGTSSIGKINSKQDTKPLVETETETKTKKIDLTETKTITDTDNRVNPSTIVMGKAQSLNRTDTNTSTKPETKTETKTATKTDVATKVDTKTKTSVNVIPTVSPMTANVLPVINTPITINDPTNISPGNKPETPEEKKDDKQKRWPYRRKGDDSKKIDLDKERGRAVIAWRQGSLKIDGKMQPVWIVVRKQGDVYTKYTELRKPNFAQVSKGKPNQTITKAGSGKVRPFKVKVGFSEVTVDLSKAGNDKLTYLPKFKMPNQTMLNNGLK